MIDPNSIPTPPRFTIHPIDPTTDYPTLTTISLEAFKSNPLHYLTFSPSSNIPHSQLLAYHRATRIELLGEGSAVQTFKIVDNSPGNEEKGKIAGFASWVFEPQWPKVRGVSEPEGMDRRFTTAFRSRISELLVLHQDISEDAIELHLMRVLPQYQGKGLGSMLLNWRLSEARKEGKKVFLTASPQGRGLYLKWGFKVLGEVRLQLREFMDDGEWESWMKERSEVERKMEEVYVQSIMVWDPDDGGDR